MFFDGEKRNCAEEIDIIASDKEEKNFILGECKFRKELFDNGELRKLKEKMELPGKMYYYLFSLSGFTDTVNDLSKSEDNLFLIDVNDIVSTQY